MEVMVSARLRVADPSAVGEARRRSAELARALGLGEVEAGRLALVVTEAASNVVKHAREGEILLRPSDCNGAPGVDVLAIDRGPGIHHVGEALKDGYSTGGTPGTGLGAIARTASRFDLYSSPAGAAVLAQICPDGVACAADPIEIGGINVPHPAESLSGDACAWQRSPDGAVVLVADGLGHGPHAAEASRAASAAFEKRCGAAPAEILEEIHRALRPTRGAAVAVAALDRRARVVHFAGIGNIAGVLVSGAQRRSLVSHHGTAGGAVRRIHEFHYPWSAGDLLVLHSDGLTSHWSLESYPGIARRHPALIAALLYRDHRRAADDVGIVVLREAA